MTVSLELSPFWGKAKSSRGKFISPIVGGQGKGSQEDEDQDFCLGMKVDMRGLYPASSGIIGGGVPSRDGFFLQLLNPLTLAKELKLGSNINRKKSRGEEVGRLKNAFCVIC